MSRTPSWIETIAHQITQAIPKDFVGQVEINVFKGGISSVNLKESFKPTASTR